ncbi:hypothetical protein MCOR05_010345 [Pyricularia oryzae]|nr:hypothetical protein MCOR05_010345 [Pyricularia oryzae]
MACGILLAEEIGSRDVVFGRVVSGRQGLPLSCQQIFSPCTNAVPVRVRTDGHSPLRNLLRDVQDQYGNSLPFETLRLNEIKENCTDWQDTVTDFGCCTVYQNFDTQPEIQSQGGQVRLQHLPLKAPTTQSGNYEDTVQRQLSRATIHDIYIEGKSDPDVTHLRIIMGARRHICDKDTVERILDKLCERIRILNSALQNPSAGDIRNGSAIYILGTGNMGSWLVH